MRNHGSRFEPLRMKPHDHICWVFSGSGEFAVLAESFLAEGASLNERLMYVAEDPDVSGFGEWVAALYPGTLTTASVAEVYGASGIVDAPRQRATFAQVLTEALAGGYNGIRVAADNTPLVLDQERLESWVHWEIVADHFMSENQVTGLCAFDGGRVDLNTLRNLETLHPLSMAERPKPPFRLFNDEGILRLEGEVSSRAVGQLSLALQHLSPTTHVAVDLATTETVTKDALSELRRLCETGVTVTVQGATEIVQRLGQSVGLPVRNFSWAAT